MGFFDQSGHFLFARAGALFARRQSGIAILQSHEGVVRHVVNADARRFNAFGDASGGVCGRIFG